MIDKRISISDKDKTAIIVCGGKGSRLGALSKIINKNLLPYKGKPIILEPINIIQNVLGCKRIVFITGYLDDQVEMLLKQYVRGVEIVFVKDEDIHGTAGALYQVVTKLGIKEFIYAHGNIAIGDKSLDELQKIARKDHTFILVSGSAIASTHPRIPVTNGRVEQDGKLLYSVGLASLPDLTSVKGNVPPVGATVEEWLLDNNLLEGIECLNIGNDWLHLEDLSFYESTK